MVAICTVDQRSAISCYLIALQSRKCRRYTARSTDERWMVTYASVVWLEQSASGSLNSRTP